MSMTRFRSQKSVNTLLCSLLAACCLTSSLKAAEAPAGAFSYYEVRTGSILTLDVKIAELLTPLLSAISLGEASLEEVSSEIDAPSEEDIALAEEQFPIYVAGLDSRGYATIIATYIRRISDENFEMLVGAEFSEFLNVFVDRMDEEEFAPLFSQYLGELASSYLTSGSDKSFVEYMVSSSLNLTPEQFSNLYVDYIETLWQYYVTNATPEQLSRITEDDKSIPLNSANLVEYDEKYFDELTEHLTVISEEEFLTDYRFYITQEIGRQINETTSSGTSTQTEVPPTVVTNTVVTTETNSEEGPTTETISTVETVIGGDTTTVTESGDVITTQTVTQTVIPPPMQTSFSSISTEESMRLIRRRIASIAIDIFLEPFKKDFIESTQSYTDEFSIAQLGTLLGIPVVEGEGQVQGEGEGLRTFDLSQTGSEPALPAGVKNLVDWLKGELAASSAANREELASLELFGGENFLNEVKLKLRVVENIPYPNRRLLEIALLAAIAEYNADERLDEGKFETLRTAVLSLVAVYAEFDPTKREAVDSQQQGAEVETAQQQGAEDGEVDWLFIGCGCEIEPPNVIYGFYPSWLVPEPGDAEQSIDFRFYDRVAYFGLALDENGNIPEDDHWRENGVLNDFIQNAHIRNTRIDLAVYSPTWHKWESTQIDFAVDNLQENLSFPLRFGPVMDFASNYLVPIFPTYSETIGKNTMGDGLTLYFDDLENPDGTVRDLTKIISLVIKLSQRFEIVFPGEPPPINLMLDFKKEHTVAVLEALKTVFIGTPTNPDQYISRVLIFLEPDSYISSQNLSAAVRGVFRDNDSAAVLRKVSPILIPSMSVSEERDFPSLTQGLNDLRWTFGNAGGAAIWPIPLNNNPNGAQIEQAFEEAMIDPADGFWIDIRSVARRVYFSSRLPLIFAMTGLFLLSMLILIWSIREPIKPLILVIAKTLGFTSFVLFMLSAIFIDPYINQWRIVFFLVPLLFVVTIVPMQNSSMPNVKVNLTGNRYIKRRMKMQRSRVLRGLRRKVKQGWSSNES
jgi:hypothetical protein